MRNKRPPIRHRLCKVRATFPANRSTARAGGTHDPAIGTDYKHAFGFAYSAAACRATSGYPSHTAFQRVSLSDLSEYRYQEGQFVLRR